jgi:hypothetical protein
MVCIIHRIWEQQLHTEPLWWIGQLKIISKKTSKREKIQENDKSQKCYFGQSHNPQNRHQKKPTKSSEEEEEYQILNSCVCVIPEDTLNCRLMRRPCGSLKVHTHAHDKLNVRACCREVQEGANHAHVLTLVNRLIIFI